MFHGSPPGHAVVSFVVRVSACGIAAAERTGSGQYADNVVGQGGLRPLNTDSALVATRMAMAHRDHCGTYERSPFPPSMCERSFLDVLRPLGRAFGGHRGRGDVP